TDGPLVANAFYRNSGQGAFTEHSAEYGINDTGYGMGALVGDYDADGSPDLYVTNFGPNVLYRNARNGTFVDVSDGVDDAGWGTSAAFADVDLDGDIDLFVGNYVFYPLGDDMVQCWVGNSRERLYCDPRKFAGQMNRLYLNGGADSGWTWTDATGDWGLESTGGKELGVIFADYDNDGDPDLYLANDMVPNMLYRNDGQRFIERGLASGTSLNDEGSVEAGMGVDMGDVDGDGLQDFFVTNFQWESNTLYRNAGHGFFIDSTVPSGVHKASMAYLGFGAGFIDYDNDGDLDIFVANGHVYDNVEKVDHASSYPQRNQLLSNRGDGTFTEVAQAGPGLDLLRVSRGAAFADYDGDGDTDVAVNNSGGPAALLRNDGGNTKGWLGIELVGLGANTNGLGAEVEVVVGKRTMVRQMRSGGSYLSSHDMRLLFGLDAAQKVDRVTVRWSSGKKQTLEQIAANQYVKIEERDLP
ncbi:MAG: CRTAC1 family protein, partial [Candidatus Latescibacterota bacterium]